MQSTISTSIGGNGSASTGAREPATQMGDKAHAGLDRLTQSAHSTIDRMTAAAGSAAERLSEGRLANIAQEWRTSTTAYVRERPMTAIGIAVAAVVGVWMRGLFPEPPFAATLRQSRGEDAPAEREQPA